MPDPSLDSFFFWNSGSEAVEAAVKMARLVTGKQNIITMQGRHTLVFRQRKSDHHAKVHIMVELSVQPL